MDYQRDEHRVHLISYHLVWTPKRRKALLVGEIERECRALIEQACRDAGWQIHELVVRPIMCTCSCACGRPHQRPTL